MVEPAARQTDTIKHRSFWAALAGAVAGALVSAAILGAASFLCAGFGGFVIGMGILLSPAVSSGIDTVKNKVESFFTPPDPDGTIILGSPNVFANNLPLAYAAMDNSDVTIACKDHSPPTMIAEGSETVFVNGLPVARKGDRTTCGAKINSGSSNIFIGSGKAQYAEIAEEFSLFERILLIGVEFVIPPTAIFGKGIAKALKNSYKSVSTRGAKVGAGITHKMANLPKYHRFRPSHQSKLPHLDMAKATNKQKGNFGEMAAARNMLKPRINVGNPPKNYNLTRIGKAAPKTLDDKIRKGIDGIYQNSTPPPKFVIDEAKFGTGKLNPKTKDGPQMSDNWLKGRKRLEKEVGLEKAEEIFQAIESNQVEKILSQINPLGKVKTFKLDKNGKIIGSWP
ncbi:PAAR domain-containing protein [Pasteurella testudinis]|nr:PAAR domain-containing protein [Pasteurella testudinis]SUB52189.1 Uncharacterized conserved protein [Pasteurella testudinis]